MKETSKFEKRIIRCPETKKSAYLMVEWRMGEDGKDQVNSISCDNPDLHDLGGGDCRWSCLETIS
jgi:hypothetical protein